MIAGYVLLIVVMCLAVAGVHWYLWARLVRDVSGPGGWYRRVGTVLAAVLPVLTVLALTGSRLGLPFGVLGVVAWPGYYWLAAVMYLLPALLVGELARRFLMRRGPRRARGVSAGAEKAGDRAAAPGAGEEGVRVRVTEAAAIAAEPAAGAGPRPAAGGVAERRAAVPRQGPEQARDGGGPDPSPVAGGGGEGGSGVSPSATLARRRFVSRLVAGGAGLVAAGTVGYGSYAARRLRTKHVTVSLAKLPRAAHGYRIAVVSDIHLNPLRGRSHCQRVVDAVNRTQPDLITVVGDLVDGEVSDLRSAAAPLAGLRSREGAFFVTGNHEYYVDTEEWIGHVRELGLTPLENAREELPYFDLAGVNDLQGEGTEHGGPDFGAALGDRDTRRTAVLMAHQPVQIYDAVDYGVGLQLSGHTHGGQLWPATYVAAMVNPTLAGLERYGDTQLYVTRGAGTWGPPVRVGADPDITVIRLESRAA